MIFFHDTIIFYKLYKVRLIIIFFNSKIINLILE